jgi:ubiquinone/menaquinone biosynthesis C-methylase UbiE
MISEIAEFYDSNPQYEWDRLARHRTEFAVTLRAFKEYLPKPPSNILEIGGGPGRYAITLTQQGYAVTLFDLSKNNLEFACRKAAEAGVELTDYVHGTATDLSCFPKESFDAVLLMGPLYHLLTLEERKKAVAEAAACLKPGGLLFASFIVRYAPFRYAAKARPDWLTEDSQHCERILSEGLFRPSRKVMENFTHAYYAHPTEIKPLMEQGGLETLELLASEGVVSLIEEQLNELAGELWETWVDMNYRLGKDPCVHGAAEHLLYVGRKK